MNNPALSNPLLIGIFIFLNLCNNVQSNKQIHKEKQLNSIVKQQNKTQTKALKVNEIPLPEGYSRIHTESNSFASYLQNLPLNIYDNNIYSYDGTIISSGGYHYAIIDLDIGNKNLQQCADAIIRLRAEYLYSQKKFDEIHFNFLSDGKPRYFNDYCKEDKSYKQFRKYLDYIFAFANTSSLYDEMEKVDKFSELKIGDIFIQKGKPIGHAVIVVDMAINIKTNEKLMLIAQSYMPAQSIHILLNKNDIKSPWFTTDFDDALALPSWTFVKNDLKRFK